MVKYQTLIFDLGNVVLPLSDEVYWWENTWCGIFEHPEKIHQLRTDGFFVQYEKGDFDSDFFLQHLTPYLKSDRVVEDILKSWNKLLQDIPPQRIEFLRKLKEKYQVYLLSNTNPIHLEYIIDQLHLHHGKNILEELFHECFYSYQILDVKPEASIYQKVLKKTGATAEATLFIDDKITNIEGAAQLGIQTLHISPQEDIVNVLKHLL